jgi:hypothetical protein
MEFFGSASRFETVLQLVNNVEIAIPLKQAYPQVFKKSFLSITVIPGI